MTDSRLTNHRRAGAWVAATVLLLALGACGDSDDDSASDNPTSEASGASPSSEGSPPTADDLDGTEYESTAVEGHDLVEGTTLLLGFEDGGLTVRAGCNTMSSSYSVEDGTLKWSGPAASTMMICSDELNAQDQWVTELFTTGVPVSLDDTGLTLANDDVTIQLSEHSSGG